MCVNQSMIALFSKKEKKSGDQLVHTNCSLYARINPQWLRELGRLCRASCLTKIMFRCDNASFQAAVPNCPPSSNPSTMLLSVPARQPRPRAHSPAQRAHLPLSPGSQGGQGSSRTPRGVQAGGSVPQRTHRTTRSRRTARTQRGHR